MLLVSQDRSDPFPLEFDLFVTLGVKRVHADQTDDLNSVLLSNTVTPILSLAQLRGRPGKIDEHHCRSSSKGDTDATSINRSREHTILASLELRHQLTTILLWGVSSKTTCRDTHTRQPRHEEVDDLL